MKKAQQNKRHRKLEQAYNSFHDGGTKKISLLNDGADDKFSITLAATGINGESFLVEIADRLNKDERKVIDVSGAAVKVTHAAVMWRDRNGIGRFTCAAESQSGKFFLSLTCWWLRVDDTVEENLVYGSESFNKVPR